MSSPDFDSGRSMDPSDAARDWLVTFGDLLTLLVCFFIATISLGTNGKGETEASATPANAAGEHRAGSGTVLANTSFLREQKVIELRAGDFDSPGGRLSFRAAERVKQAVETIDCSSGTLLVSACAKEDREDQEASWFAALQGAYQVRSHFIDSGVPEDCIGLSIRGPRCETLSADSPDAVITAEMRAQPVEWSADLKG